MATAVSAVDVVKFVPLMALSTESQINGKFSSADHLVRVFFFFVDSSVVEEGTSFILSVALLSKSMALVGGQPQITLPKEPSKLPFFFNCSNCCLVCLLPALLPCWLAFNWPVDDIVDCFVEEAVPPKSKLQCFERRLQAFSSQDSFPQQ
jgi:hypothetical protein